MSARPSGALLRPAPTSPLWVAVGAGVAGIATYVLLVVTGRTLGAVEYGRFSVFWAAVVVTSLGVFLPFEQVVARRRAAGVAVGGALLRTAVRHAALVAVVAVVVVGVLLAQDGPGAVAAFAVACAGFVWQFPARGVLAGERRLRGYAVIVCVDAVVRAAAAGGLALAGVRSVTPYLWAVALSSVLCAVTGRLLARKALRGEEPSTDAGPSFAREAAGLVVAMLCMQALLNSGVLVAGRAADPVAAGHLLAALSLARLPVFVTQAAQAAYVTRIAQIARARQRAPLVRLLGALALAVGAIGAAMLVVALGWGPAIVRLVFGPEFDLSGTAVLLVVGGVAAYLVASVSNDATVALGGHRWSGPAWTSGAVVGVLLVLLVRDELLRTTLPLLVGAGVAAAVLVPYLVSRVRRVAR